MCVTFLFMDTLSSSLICSKLEFTSEESELSKWSRKALKKPCKGPTETLSSCWLPTDCNQKKKKKLATWSTRLASNGPGLYFSNLITLLLKNFCQDCSDARKAKRRLLCFDGAKKRKCVLQFGQKRPPKFKTISLVCSV